MNFATNLKHSIHWLAAAAALLALRLIAVPALAERGVALEALMMPANIINVLSTAAASMALIALAPARINPLNPNSNALNAATLVAVGLTVLSVGLLI